MNLIYTVLAIIFAYIRQFYLPNQFETWVGDLTTTVDDLTITWMYAKDYALYLNLVFSGAIGYITYKVVNLYYTKRVDFPIKGCILYMFFYIIHTLCLCLIGLLNHDLKAFLIVGLLYVLIHVLYNMLFNWKFYIY